MLRQVCVVPLNALSDDSLAYELMVKGSQTTGPRKQSGEVWFQNDDAESYELHEHSMLYPWCSCT